MSALPISGLIVQYAGLAIIAAALLQVLVSVYGATRRTAQEAMQRRLALAGLRERLQVQLDTARVERDRRQLGWDGARKFVLERRVEEARDICSFYLKPHDGKPIPPFQPGQYLTFQLRIPGEPKPVIRCYSLSDGPQQGGFYRVTIKRIPPPRNQPDARPGLASGYFHTMLNQGDLVDVKAPSGHFHLDTLSNRPVVLIGGGIGLTPVLAMLNYLCASGSKRETWFFYGVRNRAEHAFCDHLQALAREHENLHLVVCYSEPTEACVEGQDYHHRGHVSVDLFKQMLPSNNYEFYICGPPPMMDSITTGLREWGVPDADVRFEAFGPATVKRSAHPAPAAQQQRFEVVFARSGKTCEWSDAAGTLLDLAEAHGIGLDFGCRAGNCGTCETAVKEGEVGYVVATGSQPDEGSCLTCVAVPKGRLVLDA